VAGSDRDLAPPVRDVGHRLARVDEQVQDHLLELYRVSTEGRQCGVQSTVDRNALPHEIVAQHLHDFVDQLVEIQTGLGDVLLAGQSAKAPDDCRGPLGVGGDVGQCLGDVRVFEASLFEQSDRRLGIRHDGGQWLVDLVGERGAQLAEGRDTLRVCQLLALPPGLFLGLTA